MPQNIILGDNEMSDLTNDQVVDYLSNLTILQVKELVDELEDKWGVSAAAAVAVAAAVAGAAASAFSRAPSAASSLAIAAPSSNH